MEVAADNDALARLATPAAAPMPQIIRRQRSIEKRPLFFRDDAKSGNHHTYATRFSLSLTAVSLLMLGGLSLAFSDRPLWGAFSVADDQDKDPVPRVWLDATRISTRSTSYQNNKLRGLEDSSGSEDYTSYSCHYIYEQTPYAGPQQCQFARTCNGGEGVWASFVFCSEYLSPVVFAAFISPVVLLWMVLVFRMLASTAEDYFAPALEMFSARLGLPPRFAGVSLLALSNGASDVSATISAITDDPAQGYDLALGGLTGAGMMITGLISAVVVLTADGVSCRGALVRDVIVFLVAIILVWKELASGAMGTTAIILFISLYCVYVVVVLVADIYHRAVELPRRAEIARQMERVRQLEEQRLQEAALQQHDFPRPPLLPQEEAPNPTAARNPIRSIMIALSNYDANEAQQSGWGVESDDLANERPLLLYGSRGILRGKPGISTTTDDETGRDSSTQHQPPPSSSESAVGYSVLLGDTVDRWCVESGSMGIPATNWSGALYDGTQELMEHASAVWQDILRNPEVDVVSKFLLLCELPFTVLRKITIPVPCEGYYVRALVSLSLALSPLWLIYYLSQNKGVNVLSDDGWLYWIVIGLFLVIVAVLVLRFAPGGYGTMTVVVSAPIAFYGFIVAGTWIDVIADALVDVLNFVGIILGIPGPIIGITLLAWGNCIGDMSANVTMAHKGLANMAMTACFAGPVFNILVGLGAGFYSLSAETGQRSNQVALSPSVMTGFVFLILNSILVLVAGLVGKGRITSSYGYAAIGLYALYIIMSISVQYSMGSAKR